MRFDVRADRGGVVRGRAPCREDASHRLQQRGEIRCLPFEERVHMRARRGPNSAQRDDVLYLRECQAEPATLLDKRQHTQDFG